MKTKLIQIFKKSSYWLSVVTLGIILGLSIQFAKAWTEPTDTPPDGNVEAPINVGDNIQYKAGTLGIGKILHGYSNAIFDGNVGIGTTSPGAKLDVQNSVLVQYSSPVYGVAIRSSNGGGWSRAYHFMKRDDNSILGGFGGYGGANSLTYLWAGPSYSSPYMVWETSGNVGIGTTNPNAKLHVFDSADVSQAKDILIGSSIRGYPDDVAKIQVQRGKNLGQGWNFIVNTDGSGEQREAMRITSEGNVEFKGSISASGAVQGSRLCIGSACRTSWPLTDANCTTVASGFAYGSANISCPSSYPFAISGGCDSNCAWIQQNYLNGNTQFCRVVLGLDGYCIHAGQYDVRATIKCCR